MSPQEELARYFELCGFEPDDTISVVTRAGADGPLFWGLHTVAEAPRQIMGRSGINCWISANPMREPDPDPETGRRGRGASKDVYAIRALWADLDIKDGGLADKATAQAVLKELANLLGARPVAVVMSGHGFQPRWRLENPLSPERMTPVIEGFGRLVKLVAERHGGKVDPVFDLPRIIRAPHTTNIKPGLEPVATKVWLYPESGAVSVERLQELIEEYVPLEATPKGLTGEPENRHVGLERGNAYVKGALEAIKAELAGIASWSAGQTDDRGRGWEKIQADAAYRLAGLAKAEWNALDIEQAKNLFVVMCPTDEHWTTRNVLKKWNAQVRRAEAAPPPADVDDPLAPGAGGSSPLGRAAASSHASDAAASSDARPAGQARGGGESAPAQEPVGEELATGWRRFSWDDFGNADRTIALYGNILRYSPMMKRWLRYEDGAWRESETGGERCVQDMLRQLWGLEGRLYSDVVVREGKKAASEQDNFADWLKNQRAASKVSAAAKVIRNDGKLDVPAAAFDAEAMLLNCPNGVIDLFSGELLEHDPALMLRRQIPVNYDPTAKARRWEAFLERVMPSVDMRDYLQRIIGYSITGRTSEQVVFFHVGPPASGKSVFLRIMEAILGEFSRVVPPSTLLNKKMEQHPTDVMGMEGRRMLQVSETPEGARLDEALVKRLSGEETITARGMGENFRDFRIVGKVHLVTNHDPGLSDDPAVARRLHYIPWNVTIPAEERNPFLAEQIMSEELEGVLAWAVQGTKRWLEDRLAKPVEAETARSRYLASQDEFGQFMDDELILGAETFTESKVVYRRYRQWAEAQGAKPMSMVAFGRRLSSRGIETARTMHARGFKVGLVAPRWVQDPLG